MVRAILDGRKGQTRRVVIKYVHGHSVPLDVRDLLATLDDWRAQKAHPAMPDPRNLSFFKREGHVYGIRCPYGVPGDRLWVRETWSWIGDHRFEDHRSIYWKADRSDWLERQRWRPSIYMPRWASRITLEITNVRVERLQEITAEDIAAEGMPVDYTVLDRPDFLESEQRIEFARLWNTINGKRAPWSSNPWVFVISFRRLTDAG